MAATPEQTPPSSQMTTAPPSNVGAISPPSSTQAGPGGTGASLYVGELDPSVTEAMLFEIFNIIGPVASIRVCRDAVTRRSLGYAYVNYLNAADGERALEHLNYSAIKGRPCRIMWSQRDPALRKTGQGNIFIKNLDESIDNKALHDTFAAFGEILSCKVGVDEDGKSRGFAFVHYQTGEAADAAIKGVDGMMLNDKKVFVGHHIGKKERQSKAEEQRAHFTNVFVKNVDLSVTEKEFEDLVSKFGETVSIALSLDEEGKSKGFGFVNYVSHEAAEKAVDELNDKEVNGQKLWAGRAQKRVERDTELRKTIEEKRQEFDAKSAGVNLYVKNLDDEWDDDRLRAEFDSFGTITSCKVMKDERGVSRNFGFVCYSSPEEATKAVSEMNGKMIGSKPLYVALAQRREARRQALESQIAQRTNQRVPYAPGGMPQGYMNQPMYGYPPMPGYGQPGMMPMRPMMGYNPQMMQQRPRYPPAPMNQPGMGMPPMPYGMPPQQMPYAIPPNYPVRPGPGGISARPPTSAPAPAQGRINGGPSPVGYSSGLPGSMPRQMPMARPGYDQVQPQQNKLSAQALARAPLAEQKQMLGEALYPLIGATQPELAGKITGMLLEMDNSELLHLIESPPALLEKVDEALKVLEEWGKEGGHAEGDVQEVTVGGTDGEAEVKKE